ncbi:peptidoglycan-binding protein [bacterium]|nr:peptidoglycan-binding protein [bacterium]
MTVRTFLLFGVLLVVGGGAFRDALDGQRKRREALRTRWGEVSAKVKRVSDANRYLRRQIVALRTDRYYVERVARTQLRWRRPTAPAGDAIVADVLMAYDLPSLEPTFDSPLAPEKVGPTAPVLSPEERGAQALAALGYGSLQEFQNKMLQGAPTRQFDEQTLQRAEALVAMVKQLGFDTVKAFQKSHRLRADGVLGPKTEKLAARELAKATVDARGTQALAALGYTSLEHFQRKMLHGPPSKVMDERTVKRAEELLSLVAGLGFDSVRALQEKQGLKPDGVLGRKTEELASRAVAEATLDERAQQALAALGYTSVGHFQRKMMGGRPTGRLDRATQRRAVALAGMIRSLGFASVKEFQSRNGLKPDGVFGRVSEKRAAKLLRSRGRRPDTAAASVALNERVPPGRSG